jgi:hypothetical protein
MRKAVELKVSEVVDRAPGPFGSTWVEVDAGEWTIAYRVVEVGQTREIAELRIFPTAGRTTPGEWTSDPATVPARGLTATVLRQVQLREHRFLIEHDGSLSITPPAYDGIADDLVVLQLLDRPAMRARWGHDIYYAALARLYAKLVEGGERNPNKRIGSLVGRPPTQIRDALHQARVRGMLTPPPQPRVPGGTLTPKTRKALERLPRLRAEIVHGDSA